MEDASNDKTIGRTNLSGSPVRVAQQQASSNFDKNPLSSTTRPTTQVVANDETAAATSKPLVYTAPPAVGGTGGGSSFEWPTNADHYQLINRIGQGAFASVWRARIIRSRNNNTDDYDNQNDEGDNTDAPTAESNKTDEIHCAIKIMDLEHVNINISGELIFIRAAVFEN